MSKEIEEFAKELHNYYEERAEVNNWETQKSCKVEFEDLPEANKQTMIDLASYILSIESFKITTQQQKIEQLEKEVERLRNYVSRKVETRDLKKYSELEIENTKLKEQVKELKGDSDLAYNLLNEEMRKKMFPNGRKKFSL